MSELPTPDRLLDGPDLVFTGGTVVLKDRLLEGGQVEVSNGDIHAVRAGPSPFPLPPVGAASRAAPVRLGSPDLLEEREREEGTGSVKMSPPLAPWSLISPPIKAIVLPSGDQRGTAICMSGFSRSRVFPEARLRTCSWARYQLSSPEPWAALSTQCLLSGDQSYS